MIGSFILYNRQHFPQIDVLFGITAKNLKTNGKSVAIAHLRAADIDRQ
jgi:hypothetical protein